MDRGQNSSESPLKDEAAKPRCQANDEVSPATQISGVSEKIQNFAGYTQSAVEKTEHAAESSYEAAEKAREAANEVNEAARLVSRDANSKPEDPQALGSERDAALSPLSSEQTPRDECQWKDLLCAGSNAQISGFPAPNSGTLCQETFHVHDTQLSVDSTQKVDEQPPSVSTDDGPGDKPRKVDSPRTDTRARGGDNGDVEDSRLNPWIPRFH
ncbi:hypothetical protein EV356DRAFT_244424 [Viridothelium virens]|uniref:Uncharacterized protein n=1 Tax=Viridothelium virens TaxID=1048519 RepID=A0A6A6H3Z7_VIRVR|nr:hypothetical protein EV356DRAFT_244424 [Viridothelium virens]